MKFGHVKDTEASENKACECDPPLSHCSAAPVAERIKAVAAATAVEGAVVVAHQ